MSLIIICRIWCNRRNGATSVYAGDAYNTGTSPFPAPPECDTIAGFAFMFWHTILQYWYTQISFRHGRICWSNPSQLSYQIRWRWKYWSTFRVSIVQTNRIFQLMLISCTFSLFILLQLRVCWISTWRYFDICPV